MEKVLTWIKDVPLAALGALFRLLVERVYAHRQANKGYVPREIFEPCLGLAGVTVSVQIVNELVDVRGRRIGFALKQREPDEAGWAGLYHSTCGTARLPDDHKAALMRNTEETFGKVPADDKVEFLGVTIHDEPERWSACYTIMHRRKVRLDDLKRFVGTWLVFRDDEIRARNPEIVDHNCFLLDWVMDENREPFADVRGGYKRE
ncbi:hypothetical protein HY374_03230 [Candidatus Berkelbacteria bacterium]|nr:hypothetical protein [Candidatus Berkelbacteria bacterium]